MMGENSNNSDQERAEQRPGDFNSGVHKLSEQPFVHPTSTVVQSELGAWTEVGPNCHLTEAKVGDYSYLAGDVQMIYSDMGKYCSIASHVRINPGNHPMWRVMQHHATYRRVQYGFAETDDEEFFNWRREHRVVVGHDVWIGHGAIVMPGIRVGTGAVVGSSAVVTKDVEPYTVVVGVPAKPLRERFPRDVAEKLMLIAWWDWPHDVMKERLADFNDLERFIEMYG